MPISDGLAQGNPMSLLLWGDVGHVCTSAGVDPLCRKYPPWTAYESNVMLYCDDLRNYA